MRQHKLRAWDKRRKAMFAVMEVTYDAQYDSGFSKVAAYPYDDWNRSENSEGEWANRAPRDWVYLHDEVDNLILMESVNFKDGHGKRVYEDDIIECNYSWYGRKMREVCQVKRDEFMRIMPFHEVFAFGGVERKLWIECLAGKFEVIGNAHENAILLEKLGMFG